MTMMVHSDVEALKQTVNKVIDMVGENEVTLDNKMSTICEEFAVSNKLISKRAEDESSRLTKVIVDLTKVQTQQGDNMRDFQGFQQQSMEIFADFEKEMIQVFDRGLVQLPQGRAEAIFLGPALGFLSAFVVAFPRGPLGRTALQEGGLRVRVLLDPPQ